MHHPGVPAVLAAGIPGLQCSQGFNAFVATSLHHGQPRRELEEQDTVHAWFSRQDLLTLVAAGQMPDDASLAAYALLTLWETKELATR